MNAPNEWTLQFIFLNLVLGLVPAALAQEALKIGAAPTELQTLAGKAVGVWEITAKCRFSPDATVFEGESIESVYWSKSGQFLISDQRGRTPGGWVNKLQVTTWDPIKKHFQIIDLTPGGCSYEMVMTIADNTGKVTGSRTSAGHTTRIWLTIEYVSPTESHFRSECSIDGGPKWLFSEGISRKVKNKK